MHATVIHAFSIPCQRTGIWKFNVWLKFVATELFIMRMQQDAINACQTKQNTNLGFSKFPSFIISTHFITASRCSTLRMDVLSPSKPTLSRSQSPRVVMTRVVNNNKVTKWWITEFSKVMDVRLGDVARIKMSHKQWRLKTLKTRELLKVCTVFKWPRTGWRESETRK